MLRELCFGFNISLCLEQLTTQNADTKTQPSKSWGPSMLLTQNADRPAESAVLSLKCSKRATDDFESSGAQSFKTYRN